MRSYSTRESQTTIGIDRRDFLKSISASGVLVSGRTMAQPIEPRLTLPAETAPARVVLAESRMALRNGIIHETILREMLGATLTELTGAPTIEEAWRTLLTSEDIIGIKFNRSAQRVIGTTRAVGGAIIGSLISAGWDAGQIVCIEAPADIARKYRTRRPITGFAQHPTDFGSGADQLASVLDQITALIDVPFLKTHNIAGMTCAMKNLSHGLIKHPARYHENGCSPFVADIVALPQIRSKLRLCLVDGLRVVYDGGPDPRTGTISDEGLIISSIDPVATDSVALTQLNQIRTIFELPRIANAPEEVPYLAAGHRKGIGVALLHGIDLRRIFP